MRPRGLSRIGGLTRILIGTGRGRRVAGFQLDGVFIGATRTHELMKAMAASLVVFLLATWALTGSLGNHGLWLALTLFMVARGITLAVQVPSIERASCAPDVR